MQKQIFFFSSLICLLFSFSTHVKAFGDDYKKTFEEAEVFFSNENYPAALPLYIKLDSMEKGNANTNFKIGLCYLNASTYKTKSIPYFEVAIKNISKKYEEGMMSEKAAPFSTCYYLAKAYHLNYEFDKAIEMYEKYKIELGTDSKVQKEINDVNHDIETCNYGKELIKKPKTVIITNLGDSINSKYPDFAPVVSLDEQTLIFTSRREGGTTNAILPDGQYFEDIYVSTFVDNKWGKAISIGPNINSNGHEAAINLSADGSKLLIYKDQNGNGGLFESELKGSTWSEPQFISAPVNSSAWESHACYSSDNRILYFVSDRSGGLGGRDIYKCLKLPSGEWGPAQNLGGVINTKYDEDGVFIHPDGKQIFFSSKGHESMGGFDIFTSFIDDENGFWTSPVNYGYPVNTTDDDVFLVTTADGKRSFFSSDKEGGFGEKDIYMISVSENEPRDITILVGTFINKSKEDISDNKILIIDSKTKETLQELTANSSTGKFGTNLPIGSSYIASYMINGKEILSEKLDIPKGKKYQVIKREIPYYGNKPISDSAATTDSIPLANLSKLCNPKSSNYQLFFKYNKKDIDVTSEEFKTFIDGVSECLKLNSKFVIQIESSASTVPTRTFKSNENLAEARAKTAQDKALKALTNKGIKESQIVFAKSRSLVQGPEYQKDAITNKATYEQYQYIKINMEIKK